MMPCAEAITQALDQASNELGLDPWYRDCVRPLMRTGPDGFPSCCGGACEPCSQTLNQVATRALAILGKPNGLEAERGEHKA
jgi:hypothetical protein